MTAILATILGIGFLLLIHEAGHYFAARAAGIRVEVFALGFGPRLFGFRRGDTDFRIALLPLGGYVKVSGEDPTRPPRPGDLFAATVQQRLLFYAGGIILNFLFAFLLLPALFLVGVPFEAPLLGTVNAGGAAWEAGMRPGERVLEIDGRRINGFRDIAPAWPSPMPVRPCRWWWSTPPATSAGSRSRPTSTMTAASPNSASVRSSTWCRSPAAGSPRRCPRVPSS